MNGVSRQKETLLSKQCVPQGSYGSAAVAMDAFGKSPLIKVEGNGIGRWVGKICEAIVPLGKEELVVFAEAEDTIALLAGQLFENAEVYKIGEQSISGWLTDAKLRS